MGQTVTKTEFRSTCVFRSLHRPWFIWFFECSHFDVFWPKQRGLKPRKWIEIQVPRRSRVEISIPGTSQRGPIRPKSGPERGPERGPFRVLRDEKAGHHEHSILVNSPSILVHLDSGFIQIVLGFCLILIGVHRLHSCEKHWLPVPFETSSSRNQSTLDDGVHVVSVPDVVDVLGEVVRQQYGVLQCRMNESASWLSLNCYEIQRNVRKNWVSNSTETFYSVLLLLPWKLS